MTKTEKANLPPLNFVDATSRYAKTPIIYYGDRRIVTFETYKRINRVPLASDRFFVVTKGLEYRPDLLAFRVYGLTSLWWQIMEANQLKDIWEFKTGLNVRIPGLG